VFEELSEGTICQVKVQPFTEPIAFDNDFYIRDGNGTRKLEGRELADWLRRRNNR
jgi:predicted HTH transcriptional regulator